MRIQFLKHQQRLVYDGGFLFKRQLFEMELVQVILERVDLQLWQLQRIALAREESPGSLSQRRTIFDLHVTRNRIRNTGTSSGHTGYLQ